MNMKTVNTVILFGILLLSSGLARIWADGVTVISRADEDALQRAKKHVYARKWTDAVLALKQLQSRGKNPDQLSEAQYWLAYSLNRQAAETEGAEKKIELKQEAFSVLTDFFERYPDSRWVRDGRILSVELAEDLVDMGLSHYKKYIASASSGGEDMELKLVALDALLQMDREKAFPILERIIRSHPESRMRQKALFVLSQSGHPGVLPLLLEAAKGDKDPKVREKAVFWLGQVDDPKALTVLKDLYAKTGDPSLREKIVFAVSQQDGSEGVRVLIAFYRSEQSMEIKKKIIFWLGQLEDEEARKFLESLLQ